VPKSGGSSKKQRDAPASRGDKKTNTGKSEDKARSNKPGSSSTRGRNKKT
jgi:hypothetical protein